MRVRKKSLAILSISISFYTLKNKEVTLYVSQMRYLLIVYFLFHKHRESFIEKALIVYYNYLIELSILFHLKKIQYRHVPCFFI